MIYVQQIRSRKESLVPIRTDLEGDMKIEIVDVSTLNGVELLSMDSDHFIEVVTSPSTPASMSSSSSSASSTDGDSPRPRKRAKLDHMSLEEKAQHRKMMNRISAQSARDRQKAFIGQQEKVIKSLQLENDTAKEENKSLKAKNEKLTEENASLRAMVEDLENQIKKMSSAASAMEGVTIKEEPSSVQEATDCCGSFEPAVLSTVPLQKGLELQQTLAFMLLMWALSLLIWTPPKSLRHLKHFLNKSSIQKISSSTSSRLSPQQLASEKRLRTLKSWSTMKADIPDRDDDTQSTHSNSSLPLEEAEFGLLPTPVSPILPPIISHSFEETNRKQSESEVIMERFDIFNAFLDSGSGVDMMSSWNDEQLFPDFTMGEEL